MEFLEKLFGDPTELVKRVITHTSAGLVKPILAQFFNSRMNAASRQELGEQLKIAGEALQNGQVSVASDHLAAVIGAIQL